jgi:predicted site-specific integrase-resolvase
VDTIRDDLLTAQDLAHHFGVKPKTILDWHRKGRIPARRLSHKILRFSLRDVLAALEARAATQEAARPEGVASV